jgi:hypothetical protein
MCSDNSVLIKINVLEITKRWTKLIRKSLEHVEISHSVGCRPVIFNVHTSRLRMIAHTAPVGNA